MDIKNLLNLMQKVYNIRNYTDEPLQEKDKNYLYSAYSYGHSSMGNFSRELLTIEQESIRDKVIESTLSPYMIQEKNNQDWIKSVPFLAITLIEQRRAIARVGDIGVKVAVKESEGALQNLRLAATELNIGTAVIREFDEQILQRNLSLPWYVSPIAIIAGGYNGNIQTKSPCLHQNEIVHKDVWV